MMIKIRVTNYRAAGYNSYVFGTASKKQIEECISIYDDHDIHYHVLAGDYYSVKSDSDMMYYEMIVLDKDYDEAHKLYRKYDIN